MKQLADKGRFDRSFHIGDLVYVKLHAYHQVSVQDRSNAKLAPKYYGPFLVEGKIGVVAYKLKSPLGSMVYNVFHVSQLKKFTGTATSGNFSPSPLLDTSQKEPAAIIGCYNVLIYFLCSFRASSIIKKLPEKPHIFIT